MNALEQLALGLHCLGRALREATRPTAWWTVALPALAQLLAVGAMAAGTHPALSWFMAPLLTFLAGDAALRYPQLFHRLPELAASAAFLISVLLGPLAAGAATLWCDEAFHGVRPRPGHSLRAALRRGPALVLVALPAAAAQWALAALPEALAGVRLSGVTRAAVPALAGTVLLGVRAAFAWVTAEMLLGQCGPLRALGAVPHAFTRGFFAALAILAVLALPLAPFATLEGLAAGGTWGGRPELVLVLVAVHAVVQAGVTLVGAGALALAWRGAVVPAEDGA